MYGNKVDIFGVVAYPYWICYHLGFILASAYLVNGFRRAELSRAAILVLCLLQYLTGFAGARLLATMEYADRLSIVFTPRAGLTFYGGFILASLTTFCFVWWRKTASLRSYLNVAIIALAIGYAIGRVGCFLSGDSCFGTKTNLPWGLPVIHAHPPITVNVHPAPLYETFWALAIASFAHFYLRNSKWKERTFEITLALLALERFFVEFVRLNPKYSMFSLAQYISLGLIGLCALSVTFNVKRATYIRRGVELAEA